MRCGSIPKRATATKCSKRTARAFLWTRRAYLYLHNTTLDYLRDLMRQGFVFPESAGRPQLRLRQFLHRVGFPPRGVSRGLAFFANRGLREALRSRCESSSE